MDLNFFLFKVILCKDADNKVGLRVKSINKGVFVCLVTRGSPAAMGGLRFGDQVKKLDIFIMKKIIVKTVKPLGATP